MQEAVRLMGCKVMYTGAVGWLVRCRGVDRVTSLPVTVSQDKWQTLSGLCGQRVQNPAYRPAAIFFTGCIWLRPIFNSICRITLSHYCIALKGQKHQDRASPYYSGVSSQLALKGRNQDITLSGLFREVSFNP